MSESTNDQPQGSQNSTNANLPEEHQPNKQNNVQNSDRPITPPNQQDNPPGFLGSLENATSKLLPWLRRTFSPTESGGGGQRNEEESVNNVAQNQPGKTGPQEPQQEREEQFSQEIEDLFVYDGEDMFPPEADGSFQQSGEPVQEFEEQVQQIGEPVQRSEQFQNPEEPFQQSEQQFQQIEIPRNQLFFGEFSELASGIFSKGNVHRVAGQVEPARPLFPLQYPSPAVPPAQRNIENSAQSQDNQDTEMGNNNMNNGMPSNIHYQGYNTANRSPPPPQFGSLPNKQAYGAFNYPPPPPNEHGYQNNQGDVSSNYPPQPPAWGVPQNAQASADFNHPPPWQDFGVLVPPNNHGPGFGQIANQGYIQGSANTQGQPSMHDPPGPPRPAHHASIKTLPTLCPICNQQLAIRTLEKHVETTHVTPGRKPHCTICDKNYATAKNLVSHYRSQHSTGALVRQHVCPNPTCGRKFKRAQDVERHVARVHSGKKSYPCAHCDKSYVNLTGLNYHMDHGHTELQLLQGGSQG